MSDHFGFGDWTTETLCCDIRCVCCEGLFAIDGFLCSVTGYKAEGEALTGSPGSGRCSWLINVRSIPPTETSNLLWLTCGDSFTTELIIDRPLTGLLVSADLSLSTKSPNCFTACSKLSSFAVNNCWFKRVSENSKLWLLAISSVKILQLLNKLRKVMFSEFLLLIASISSVFFWFSCLVRLSLIADSRSSSNFNLSTSCFVICNSAVCLAYISTCLL